MPKLFEITWKAKDAPFPITEFQTGVTKIEARRKILERELADAQAKGKKTAFDKFIEVKQVEQVA